MRLVAFAAFAAAFAVAGPAAAAGLPFDPEAATRAWLDTMGPEATARSNAYFEGGYIIDFAGTALSIIVAGVFLFLGWARGVRAWLERTVKFYPLVAFGTSFFYLLVSSVLTFPFVYYVGFVREHRYQLSTQTFPEWFSEQAIGFALTLVIGSIFLTILYLIVRAAKNTWWIWGTLVTTLLTAVLIMAGPVFIDSLFNTYTPMQEGELKTSILEMAQANGVPADNVYVFDTSRQSNRITANVAGLFGTTRVALGDNLLERTSPEAVRAVMGHELGHYVLGHIYSILLMLTGVIIVTFAVVHYGFRALVKSERWGIRDISDPAGLPLIFGLIAVIGIVTTPIQRNIVYFHEQQADMFGLNAAREPDGFAEAAVLLSEYRKMEPSPLEEWFFYDHPSGWNRVHNSMVWKAHEIAAGRLPNTPGGPPPGWRPDFVVTREQNTTTAPSPGAASD